MIFIFNLSPRGERLEILRRPRFAGVARLLVGLQFLSAPASAADNPAVLEDLVQPPVLLAASEAVYPQGALQDRLESQVTLLLTIDTSGAVTSAEIAQSGGEAFDQAAREAALRFRFSPASRAGRPVSARIRYRYEFHLPEAQRSRAEDGAVVAARPPEAVSAPPAPPTEQARPRAAASAERAPIEIQVQGKNPGEELQRSAAAVTVVDTKESKKQAADLGEVLARTQGVGVRREGGLGSNAQISLNGLQGSQVRFFLDGVPLAISGYSFGIANVPPNLIDRIEIYRGVVPVRFGADALGGAVNLVSTDTTGSHLTSSVQVGSFGVVRYAASAKYDDAASGAFARLNAFVDIAKNDYDVDVLVTDKTNGKQRPVTVPRFHDRYRAAGATLEAGVRDRTFARLLSLRGFYNGFDKELQSPLTMRTVYGEARAGERTGGATLRYAHTFGGVGVDVVASYARRSIELVDVSRYRYNWFGERSGLQTDGARAGELGEAPQDTRSRQNDVFTRIVLEKLLTESHAIRLSVTPAYSDHVGHNRQIVNRRDPLESLMTRASVVSGLEWQFDDHERLDQSLFVKSYLFRSHYDNLLASGVLDPITQHEHHLGVGDSARVSITPWLMLKASYEYATRLPSTDELFGDGRFVLPNLGVHPETSHNLNFGPRFELVRRRGYSAVLDVNGFLREARDLILIGASGETFTYSNAASARSYGVEGALECSTPGRYLTANATSTWQDFRNTSDSGSFAAFKGDRITNTPWLFASFGLRGRVGVGPGHLEPYYVGRYVHSFQTGWESLGLRQFQQEVPAQLAHGAGVSYSTRLHQSLLTATFEVDNFTDERLYDSFGAQRPGRAYYLKLIADNRL